MQHGGPDDPHLQLERADAIWRAFQDGTVPEEQRSARTLEYVGIALRAIERLRAADASGSAAGARPRPQVAELQEHIECLFRDQARRRLRIRWLGTELADIELGGQCVAWLMHAWSGWRLTSPLPGLASPPLVVAPPGLAEPASDQATTRALDVVAEFFGVVWSATIRADELAE